MRWLELPFHLGRLLNLQKVRKKQCVDGSIGLSVPSAARLSFTVVPPSVRKERLIPEVAALLLAFWHGGSLPTFAFSVPPKAEEETQIIRVALLIVAKMQAFQPNHTLHTSFGTASNFGRPRGGFQEPRAKASAGTMLDF